MEQKNIESTDTVEVNENVAIVETVETVEANETAEANENVAIVETVEANETVVVACGSDARSDYASTDGIEPTASPAVREESRAEQGFEFSDTEEKKRWRPSVKWVIPAIFLLMAGLIGGYYALNERPVPVDVATVTPKTIERTVSGTGKIMPCDPCDVYTAAPGIIATIHVKDGQSVTKGQVLLTLDSSALELQLTQAQAALTQAQSARAQAGDAVADRNALIGAATQGVDAAYAGLAFAQNTYAQAIADADYAQAYLAWVKAQPEIDPAQIEASEQALTMARAVQRESEAAIVAAQGQIAAACTGLAQAQAGDPQSAISAADAAIVAATKQVEAAKKALAEAKIVAPTAGRVIFAPTASAAASQAGGGGTPTSGESLQVGGAVAPGTPILTIMDPTKTRFVAEIDEAAIAEVSLDQEVTITLDGYPDEVFSGRVVKVAPVATRTMTGATVFPIDIMLDESIDQVYIGMKGDVAVIVASTKEALVVPQKAVFADEGAEFVYVVSSGRLVKTAVTCGQSAGGFFEVTRGIAAGTEVALAGSTPLSEGLRVIATEPMTLSIP